MKNIKYSNKIHNPIILKGWIFNVVPWLISLPSTIFAGWFADKLIAKSIIFEQNFFQILLKLIKIFIKDIPLRL